MFDGLTVYSQAYGLYPARTARWMCVCFVVRWSGLVGPSAGTLAAHTLADGWFCHALHKRHVRRQESCGRVCRRFQRSRVDPRRMCHTLLDTPFRTCLSYISPISLAIVAYPMTCCPLVFCTTHPCTYTPRYVEKFLTQDDAERFCRLVGGTLGVPTSKEQTADVERLFKSAVARYTYWGQRNGADFSVWMGLRNNSDGWQSMTGPVQLNDYSNWAPTESTRGLCCSVVGIRWHSGDTAWFEYILNGWNGVALSALCKLPAGTTAASLPRGKL